MTPETEMRMLAPNAVFAVDLAISRVNAATAELEILTIRRKFPPYAGMRALPGGLVEELETDKAAAVRELMEETGVLVPPDRLKLLGVFSNPLRDPRGRVVSIAYHAHLPKLKGDVQTGDEAQAGDDAAGVEWLPPRFALREGLAFDHAQILNACGCTA
jgi:8-oxo-dGTP diphosphatase